MPILNIREMGMVGVNSDIAPWELPPAALSAGVNFRMSNGKIQSAGGIDIVGPSSAADIGHITGTRNWENDSRWLAMTGDDILLLDAGNWVSIAGSASFSGLDESLWSTCQIGRVTFLNHPDDQPYYWIDGDGPVQDVKPLPWHINNDSSVVTWKDEGVSCRVIRAHKNFLFALGMKEGSDEYRDKVWWSHPAEPDGIPFSWKPTIEQPDSIAGWVSLGRGGAIVGGESLRDSFVIYSEDAVNTLDYVGDALGWRRRTISASANLMAREGVVEVKGVQYFIARDDIMMFDGNTMQSVVHNRLRSRLAANVNNSKRARSWAAHYETYNEVWFGVPSADAEFPDVAYAYNYRDNTWSVRHLEAEFKHAAFASAPSDIGQRTWTTMRSPWDDERGSWAMGGDSPFAGALLGCSGRQMYDLDPGVSAWDESTVVYRMGQTGNFADWTVSGNGYTTSDDTALSWNNRTNPPWDFEEGVFAEVNFKDHEYIATETDTVLQVTVPIVLRQPIGSTQRVRVWWNGVVKFDENVTSSTTLQINKDITFSGTMGAEGKLKVEFFEPSMESAALSCGIREVMAVKTNTRTDTLISRSDLPIGGHEANTTITRIYPLIEGTSPVEIRVGSAQRAGGPIRWAGDFRTFTPGVDRKIDVRTTGETHAYEIRSSGRAFFDMTGMDIEFSIAGQR